MALDPVPVQSKVFVTLTINRTSTPRVCSDQELLAATRSGDDRAFEELYSRYRGRIFSFILSKVHDHSRAEDIAQDVFMSALRRLRRSDQAVAFKPWIYEIAKNACIDEFRRGSRAREVPLESDGELVVDRRPAALSAVPAPPAAVESKQRLDDLRGAFGGLSADHHRLLVMRELEGRSYDEIGERLDMTRQMVESSLFRARRKLTEEYQELASGERCEQIQTAIDAGRLRSVSGLGVRERRRFARHLSHCQLCRHAAILAGADEALTKPRSIGAKIGALLPFPLWRLPWRSRGARTASAAGSRHLAGAGVIPSAGGTFTLGQAAATVAVIVAGVGGTLAVTELASSGHPHAPASVNLAGRTGTQAASSSGSSAASSAAGAKAAHARGTLVSKEAGAIRSGSSTGTASKSPRRRNRGSAPGGPAGGGSGSTASTASSGTSPGSGAGGTVGRTVNGVTNTVNGVTNTVGKTVNRVTNTVGKTVNGVTSGVGQAVSGATNGATQAVGGVTSGASSAVSGVTNGASKTVGGITGGVTGSSGGSTSSSSGSSGSPSPAPVSSGVSNTVNTATQPVTSGVQQAGSILGH